MDWGALLSGLGSGIQSGGRTYRAVKEDERARTRQELLDKQNTEQQKFERDRMQKLLDLTLAKETVDAAGPNGDLTPEQADSISRTAMAPRVNRIGQLPSRSFGPAGIQQNAAGPDSFKVNPTFEQSAAITARNEATQDKEARDAFLSSLEHSKEPFDQYSAKALRAGISNPPVPFSEQKRRAREMGGIENDFALKRINAQMGRYTRTNPSTPAERAHLQIFSGIIRGNPDVENDPTSPEAQAAFQQAKEIADFYVANMGKNGATPEFTPQNFPAVSSHGAPARPAVAARPSLAPKKDRLNILGN